VLKHAAEVKRLKPDPGPALNPSAPGGALAGLPAGQPPVSPHSTRALPA